MNKTTKQVLIEARELIADPARWCQGANAKNEHGDQVADVGSAEACQWCSIGAIVKGNDGDGYAAARNALLRATPLDSIVHVNDMLGHAAVLRMFDKAIANENT